MVNRFGPINNQALTMCGCFPIGFTFLIDRLSPMPPASSPIHDFFDVIGKSVELFRKVLQSPDH